MAWGWEGGGGWAEECVLRRWSDAREEREEEVRWREEWEE